VSAGAYVRLAVLAMNSARNERELIDWWLQEHDHRRQWGLVPDTTPGLDLFEAFKARRKTLKQGDDDAS
jgi:hypothetical protein